jgi:VIT1/CCC1 family predicted Fe2+/Mn2+ transporter
MFILGFLISLIIVGATVALILGVPIPEVTFWLTILGVLTALACFYLTWAAWLDRHTNRERKESE